jgi:predicted nucleic acid-binding Zn ribbon protein
MESEHPICSTEQTQVMCTEVGRNKKKCSGGGAGQVGVQDKGKGFYGSRGKRENGKKRQNLSNRGREEIRAYTRFVSHTSRHQGYRIQNPSEPHSRCHFETLTT